jgi:CheY-like chemotaxis protein
VQSLQVTIHLPFPEHLPPLAVQPDSLRQSLINVLDLSIRSAPSGTVHIEARRHPSEVELLIQPRPGEPGQAAPSRDGAEGLEMARQLLALSDATLEVNAGRPGECPFTVRLTMPQARKVAVLVIDDNTDTLRLFQRCLAGTPFPFIGVRDPQEALALAEEIEPRVIVLDLMLPGIDGWEILGRLREHPRTRDIPIVVCSILPQEQLALTLGAAAFLRKPVTRVALLAALEQLIGQQAPPPR